MKNRSSNSSGANIAVRHLLRPSPVPRRTGLCQLVMCVLPYLCLCRSPRAGRRGGFLTHRRPCMSCDSAHSSTASSVHLTVCLRESSSVLLFCAICGMFFPTNGYWQCRWFSTFCSHSQCWVESLESFLYLCCYFLIMSIIGRSLPWKACSLKKILNTVESPTCETVSYGCYC